MDKMSIAYKELKYLGMHSWMAKSMRMITGQTNSVGNIIPE